MLLKQQHSTSQGAKCTSKAPMREQGLSLEDWLDATRPWLGGTLRTVSSWRDPTAYAPAPGPSLRGAIGPLPIGVAVKDTLALEPHWSINGEDWNWLAVIEPAIHELAELLCQLCPGKYLTKYMISS